MRQSLRRHVPFALSAALGLAALAGALVLSVPLPYAIGANVFFLAYLALVFRDLPKLTPDFLSRNASEEDPPVAVIFAVTLCVVGVAVALLFQLINAPQGPQTGQLLFSLLSLPLGWATIHVMAAMHYAHVYWIGDGGKRSKGKAEPRGGLDFPGDEDPGGIDFLYFSMTIGMTAQTADTAITSSAMRRIVTLHAVVSFFFNTVLVAAAVNLAVSFAD
jgi:uncharacterized membrane protein